MDRILKQEKRAIRIIMLKLKQDGSANENFKNLKIFTVLLYRQYILETILIAKNQELETKLIPSPYYNLKRRNQIVQPQKLK
jgi:hypothetical protein